MTAQQAVIMADRKVRKREELFCNNAARLFGTD